MVQKKKQKEERGEEFSFSGGLVISRGKGESFLSRLAISKRRGKGKLSIFGEAGHCFGKEGEQKDIRGGKLLGKKKGGPFCV